MALGLIGKKVGMTRLFDQESGAMVPVTVIDVKGNTFAQIKTEDKDGYNAIQVAFDAQSLRPATSRNWASSLPNSSRNSA
mgnify:CR=1 FL=1